MDGIYYAGYDSIMNLFPWSQAAHSLPTQEELEAWGTCFTVDDDNEDSPDRGVGAWAATTVRNLPRLARLVLVAGRIEHPAFVCVPHCPTTNWECSAETTPPLQPSRTPSCAACLLRPRRRGGA